MESRYDAQKYEQDIYRKWEESGAFQPRLPDGSNPTSHDQTFTIILPPPNANDPLHLGHAMYVVEDIMIRYQRMRGKAALWLPGTDHAGIETQFVFEKKLAKEGKSRFDFDRETLYKMIWDYVQENSDVAINQLRRLGFSLDWSRLVFTLDPDIVTQVIETFRQMHDDGLVYRDLRLVNYCTRCGTAFSNLEVQHVERNDPFIYMKYGPFTIGTVRPETKFRDTALAVNPTDARYKKHIGKSFEIMGLLGPVQMIVIPDPDVDPTFGTGIMKVTPAHDFHDFDLGKKFNLPVTPIIGTDGKMDFSWFLEDSSHPQKYLERAKRYHGIHVSKVRKMMMDDLREDGLLLKVDESYQHTVATCYRCGSVLEPLPLPQFFVKTKPLAQKALDAMKKKQVQILGAGHDKILKHWLTNIEDWNVSRQIVWGIRMPVWYCISSFGPQPSALSPSSDRPPLGTHYVISKEKPDKCRECGGTEFIQETDTFDTWFSSGQWPIVTLKRDSKSKVKSQKSKIEEKKDFDLFYPTDVMETAYDILFFWVARMLMLGLYLTNKVPFKTVYLHGLIRDEKGQKMSKSKGNVINPLTMIEKYGADALRMALVIRSTPGLDKGVGEQDIRAMRNFTNKIWNAARYVSSLPQENDASKNYEKDDELNTSLNECIATMAKRLDDYKIGFAADWIYDWFWHVYCDRYIEIAKKNVVSPNAMRSALMVLLKLLHPFVPFVTEAAWQELRLLPSSFSLQPSSALSLISSPWPSQS